MTTMGTCSCNRLEQDRHYNLGDQAKDGRPHHANLPNLRHSHMVRKGDADDDINQQHHAEGWRKKLTSSIRDGDASQGN